MRVGCLLGVDAEAADGSGDELEMLTSAGVRLELVRLERAPVFENIEHDGHRRQRWLTASDAIPVAALPAEWRDTAVWLMVPVAGELGGEWGATLPPTAALGVGWQGFLRDFAADGWVKRVAPRPSALLASAGLIVVSVDDLDRNTQIDELRPLAPRAAIVLTAGEGGGVALRGGTISRYRAARAAEIVDPTGAGDVFLSALMAAWILTGEAVTPATLRFAAAAGSCAVEGVGLAGVPTRGQVAARLRGE